MGKGRPSRSLAARLGLDQHSHDVAFLHDQVLDAVDLDLGARPFAEQHPVARLDVDGDQLARLVAPAGPEDTNGFIEGALEEGVAQIVVTHPEFPCEDISIDDQQELAALGCLLERCLSTPLSEKTTWEHVFDGVRAVGVEHNLFSSDCGNPDYPPVEDGLALWADRLLGAGFDEDEVRELVVGQSRHVAGADDA